MSRGLGMGAGVHSRQGASASAGRTVPPPLEPPEALSCPIVVDKPLPTMACMGRRGKMVEIGSTFVGGFEGRADQRNAGLSWFACTPLSPLPTLESTFICPTMAEFAPPPPTTAWFDCTPPPPPPLPMFCARRDGEMRTGEWSRGREGGGSGWGRQTTKRTRRGSSPSVRLW